jgi:hypothetical protein
MVLSNRCVSHFNFYFKRNNSLLKFDALLFNNQTFFFWKIIYNIVASNKLNNLIIFNLIHLLSKIYYLNLLKGLNNKFLKVNELELKGLNYWFTKLKSNLLLDLGRSHFQMLSYPSDKFFLSLRKKKIKKVFALSLNKTFFNAVISFFWYKLKSVGPYKLKGFQFLNERIKLKEGKKPFK